MTTVDLKLDALQRESFQYFLYETNPGNGLVADKTQQGSPASIAAVGMALAAYTVGVTREFMSRELARERTLAALRFFSNSTQGPEAGATGYKGFYYHFLDMQTGKRVWNSEISTIDTAFLLAGMLTSRAFFTEDSQEELEIRTLADELYRRADWNWFRNGKATLTHGWKPERGFLRYRWQGYDEALLLYVLGLGSPTHPLPLESYAAWASTYERKEIEGVPFLYAGPLFIHQLSHVWIDFRGIQDAYMREIGLDYFENSARATRIQRQYAIQNPLQFEGYGASSWGATATDGPGFKKRKINGVARKFYGYYSRGAPFGPDDGTIAPWAAIASLPFAPDIVLPTLDHFDQHDLRGDKTYGFLASFNPTYPTDSSHVHGWVSPYHFGINQAPIVLMIENYRSDFHWRLMRGCEYLIAGLRRGGFQNGWL